MLADAGARPRDLAAIVAGLGPGPFTGLRVGLVTAATMGQVLGIPTYGVCSLDAHRLPGGAGAPVLVATDARRKEIYWAVYDDGGQRIVGPERVDRPAAAARAGELGATVAVGDGRCRYAEVLGLPVRVEPRYPAATCWPRWPPSGSGPARPASRSPRSTCAAPTRSQPAGRKPVLP